MATKASFPRNAASAAIARVLSRASGTRADVETLKAIAVFRGIGLIVSLLFASNGLDISAGFF